MNRIRCVPLLSFLDVAPARMAEVILDRDAKGPLSALLGDKNTLAKILELAYGKLQDAMVNGRVLAPMDAGGVQERISEDPAAPELAAGVLTVLTPERLRSVRDEALERIARRDRLEWRKVTLALIPFTSTCMPEPLSARECWCGSWVQDGEASCAFCGDAPPDRDCSRVWKRGVHKVDQLNQIVAASRELEERIESLRDQDIEIPGGCDPNAYIAQLEAGALLNEEVYEHAE